MRSPTAFDHIAIALPRMADAVPFLVGVLGGVPYAGARGGPEFRFGTWRYANGGKLFVYQSSVLVLGYSFGYFRASDMIKIGLAITVVEFFIVILTAAVWWPLIGITSGL